MVDVKLGTNIGPRADVANEARRRASLRQEAAASWPRRGSAEPRPGGCPPSAVPNERAGTGLQNGPGAWRICFYFLCE